ATRARTSTMSSTSARPSAPSWPWPMTNCRERRRRVPGPRLNDDAEIRGKVALGGVELQANSIHRGSEPVPVLGHRPCRAGTDIGAATARYELADRGQRRGDGPRPVTH